MAKKTIITVAPTGAWPKKANNPNVPMTPSEIADEIYDCWQAGAAIAHLHMRDDQGNGTMDTAKFEETLRLFRERYPDCDIILNLTTSGDIHADDDIRVAHVIKLKPEMASYDCGSMNWLHTGLFLNTPQFLERCGLLFQELNVKPEIEAHVAQHGEELVRLLGRQDRGGLVQNEDVRAAVEHLDDLNGLLLGNGHIVDLLRRVDIEAVGTADLADLCGSGL